jgi:hypothetical protein
VVSARAGSLCRQIERLIAGQPPDPADHLQLELCRFLLSRGITQLEMEQLLEHILSHKWEAIPSVFFAAAIGALLDHGRIRGRKYKVNDETDIQRVAVALHCGAMMITEKSMTHLVKQLEGELGKRLDVFAMKERQAIKANLETLLAA